MTNIANIQTIPSQLQQARDFTLPSRTAMLNRAPSVQQFWDTNQYVLIMHGANGKKTKQVT